MANYDENVSFQQGSDTGTAESTSIVPISDAEVVWSGSTNRPIENLRQRTEILRRAVQDLRYYQDYDRGLVLRSEGTFSLTEPSPGKYRLVATAPLWVYPTLTPGRNCGGRWDGGRVFFGTLPYLGASANACLVLTASASRTGQRGYADGDTMATSTVLTVGANRLKVDLVGDVALSTGTFQYLITQVPATKITIRYGTASGAPSYAALIASLNATDPINKILYASSPAADPSSLYLTDFTGAVVQGAYDAEAHQVTNGQLDAFFTAFAADGYPNRLQDGEGLAIGYAVGPVETYTAPYPKGGRRQSIFDLPTDRTGGRADNTTPISGYSIFNTGREPEKIAGAVPIGKLVRILLAPSVYATEFVFIDGTRVRLGADPVALGESGSTLTRLASITGVTGASLIGYGGSGPWNPTVTGTPTALPAGTVENALDQVVIQLGGLAPGVGGARRVGFEQFAGTFSAGNSALDLTGVDTTTGLDVKSVQIALSKALNEPSTLANPGGGVNYRVSERGHRMHGPNPIEKIFSETETVSGGAQLVRAVLNVAENARVGSDASPQIDDQVSVSLRPFKWVAFDGSLTIPVAFSVKPGSSIDRLEFNSITFQRAEFLRRELALTQPNSSRLHSIVSLTKTDTGLDGFYFASWVKNATTPYEVTLRNLDGSAPDLSAASSTSTLQFFQTTIHGNDAAGNQSRHTVGEVFSGAASAYFGNGKIKQGYDYSGERRHTETVNQAVWQDRTYFYAVNNGTGATTTTGGVGLLNRLNVTSLSGMTSASVGRWLQIEAASDAALVGLWKIVDYVDATTVSIEVPDPTLTSVTGIDWKEYRDGSRVTDNILVKEDADFLRGIENGVVVDASANHMHASLYAPLAPDGYTYLSIPSINALQWVNAASNVLSLDDIRYDLAPSGDYLDATYVGGFIPSGYTPTGLYLELHIVIRLVAAGASGDAWALKIEANDGTSYDIAYSRVVFDESGHKITGSGNVDTLTRNLLVFVPCSATGQIFIRATALSGPLDSGATAIYVRLTAMANSPV